MDNFRDSYFNVTWDLTKKHLRGTFWGKQYDTGRGFAVTIVEGGKVTVPSNETVRLKWEKPDSTEGYATAVVVDDKFLIEDIDQMFTVHGAVRSDLEIWRGGKVISSITFYVSVEKAVAVDAIQSSSQFTALQEALADVGDMQAQVDAVIANATVDSEVILARGTEPTLGDRLDASDAQLADIDGRIDTLKTTFFDVSTNLFDKDKAVSGVISSQDGSLVESLNYFSTEFIPVKSSTPYTRYRFNRVLYYDENKNFIRGHSNSETNTQITNTTPNGTKFIRLSVENDVLLQDAQVTEGEEITVFEPYYASLGDVEVQRKNISDLIIGTEDLEDKSVTPEKTDFFDISTNLFNPDKLVDAVIDTASGDLVESISFKTFRYFPVIPGEKITLKNIERILYYSDNYSWTGDRKLFSDRYTPSTITVPYNAKYAGVSLLKADLSEAQINKGDTLLPYEPYYMRFMGQITSNGDLNNLEAKLELESSGLNLNTGLINSPSVNDWYTSRRTGKYLSVTPDTTIELGFDVGNAYIFEYDKGFNFIKNTTVITNQVLMLSNDTTYLKVVVDNLDNGQYVNCNLSYMSESTTPKWVYNDRKNSNAFSFVYEVDVNQGREVLINDDLETKQYTTEKYYNSALLKLPPNYTSTGKPVKLIIANGGAGSHTTFAQSDFGSMYSPYFDYLADEGYAILDLYKWTTKYLVEPNTNFGSPTSISAIVQGYKWVIDNFNVSDTGVFVWGYSAGGYPSTILDTSKGLPVLATGMFAPAISPLTRPYGYDAESRLAYADDFGFEGDVSGVLDHPNDGTTKTASVKEFMRVNAPKMIGYNGFWNGLTGIDLNNLITHAVNDEEDVMSNFENAYRIRNTPTKIWVSEDDSAVSADICKVYLQTIKNGHGVGELRLMPNGTGGHYSVTNDPNALQVESITTRCGITHENVPLAFVELVRFFRRYEN